MSGEFQNRGGPRTASGVTTLDELVLHLREAGAKRVYLSKADAFRTGAIPVIATYEYREDAEDVSDTGTEREMMVSVLEAIDDRIWFDTQTWSLEWQVELAFTDPKVDLVALYDRGVEHKRGDGFNLRSVFFVYEQYLEMDRS